jgi:sugar phosphate isomerase/epimerase
MMTAGDGFPAGGLAFSTLAFPSEPLAEAVALGRELGYDGIELRLIDGELIDPATTGAGERERVRHVIGDLPVVALDSSIRITEEGALPAIVAFLELAHDWQAPAVRVFGGTLDEDPATRTGQLAGAVDVLEQAAPVAERLGVAIGLETHDSFSAAAQVAKVLDRVESSAVGAVWDSHHPHRMGETPAEIYERIGPRVVLAQVKDARRSDEQPGGWQLVPLGEGEVPVREMLRVLARHGYAGAVSVEWERRWHPELAEAPVALRQHIELLRRWLSELGSDGSGQSAEHAGRGEGSR